MGNAPKSSKIDHLRVIQEHFEEHLDRISKRILRTFQRTFKELCRIESPCSKPMLTSSQAARWLPRDFVEASQIGGVYTLLAYLMMLILFLAELTSFVAGIFKSSQISSQNSSFFFHFFFSSLNLNCFSLFFIDFHWISLNFIEFHKGVPKGFLSVSWSLRDSARARSTPPCSPWTSMAVTPCSTRLSARRDWKAFQWPKNILASYYYY